MAWQTVDQKRHQRLRAKAIKRVSQKRSADGPFRSVPLPGLARDFNFSPIDREFRLIVLLLLKAL